MSAKIYAFTHYVNDYKQKQSDSLRMPIRYYEGLYSIGDYQVAFDIDIMGIVCLSDTYPIPYWVYFDENCNYRVQMFDCVRALGLNEVWVFEDLLYDALEEGGSSIEEAIKEIETCYNIQCHEFVRAEMNEDNYNILCHDTFTDLFQEVNELESKFNVKVLGLRWEIDPETNEKTIRVLKDDKVYYMGKETGKLIET